MLKLDYKLLRKMRLGGSRDTLGLMLLLLTVFAFHPAVVVQNGFSLAHIKFSPALWKLAMASLSGIGGALLASRFVSIFDQGKFLKSDLNIHSHSDAGDAGSNGMLLGYLVDTGQPLYTSMEEMVRHISIVGQSGVGKTIFGQLLMYQQMAKGGGIVFVDGKLDKNSLSELYRMAAYHGRQHDILVINPGNPSFSNTYNPILYGDPDEVADRIVSLIPSTESDAGADHFKQAAKQGCTVLIAALQKTGLAYTFIDLVILLSSPSDLTALEARLPVCNERTNMRIFLEQYKVPDRTGNKTIDIKRLKETFGGIGGRLFTFGTGRFGEIMNVTSPEVNLFEAMKSNKIIYVMLPTMGKAQTASNFGKMFLGDARTAFSWLQELPDDQKPNPPLLFFMDEVGSYATETLARPFEQNRSANVILCPAYQTIANLEAVSPEFLQMVTGNTWIKAYFKAGSHESAEFASETIGEEKQVQATLSVSGGESNSMNPAGVAPDQNAGTSENIGYGESLLDGYKVSPNDIKALDMGEAIITIGGNRVYHVRIPRIEFSQLMIDSFPEALINKRSTPNIRGIGLFRSAQQRFKDEEEFDE